MTDQTLRRDAARNRERLVAAGRELFAQRGLGATLNDVARHAGVGVGTACRRFATEEELIEAIWQQQVDELETILRAALAAPDPWEGLALYLERSLAAQAGDRGMGQVPAGRTWPDYCDRQRDRLAPLVHQVADRAREAGALRADVTGTDLVLLQIALTTPEAHALLRPRAHDRGAAPPARTTREPCRAPRRVGPRRAPDGTYPWCSPSPSWRRMSSTSQ